MAFTAQQRRGIWERDGGRCGICGKPVAFDRNMHIDHIMPLHVGGSNHAHNLRPTHGRCNMRRPHHTYRQPLPATEIPLDVVIGEACRNLHQRSVALLLVLSVGEPLATNVFDVLVTA